MDKPNSLEVCERIIKTRANYMKTLFSLDDDQRKALNLQDIYVGAKNQGYDDQSKLPKIINTYEDTAEINMNGWMTFWKYDNLRYQMKSLKGIKNLRVIIDSPGGDIFVGYSLYHLFRNLSNAGTKVTTQVAGMAASAAALAFLAGDERLVPKNLSRIMYHEARGLLLIYKLATYEELRNIDAEGERAKVERDVKGLNEDIVNVLVDRTNFDEKGAAETISKEVFYNAEESLSLGIATAIITDEEKTNSKSEDELTIRNELTRNSSYTNKAEFEFNYM